jgi:hypothetical protein
MIALNFLFVLFRCDIVSWKAGWCLHPGPWTRIPVLSSLIVGGSSKYWQDTLMRKSAESLASVWDLSLGTWRNRCWSKHMLHMVPATRGAAPWPQNKGNERFSSGWMLTTIEMWFKSRLLPWCIDRSAISPGGPIFFDFRSSRSEIPSSPVLNFRSIGTPCMRSLEQLTVSSMRRVRNREKGSSFA